MVSQESGEKIEGEAYLENMLHPLWNLEMVV